MKLIILTLLLTGSLLANILSTRYDVNVGMFGKVGHTDISLEEDEQTYEMKVVATTVGTAATLTGKRVETYISKGRILKGIYVPDSFTKIKKTTRSENRLNYSFDHENKEVKLIKETKKWISNTGFDTIAFKIVKKDILETFTEASIVETYKAEDLLSSYLNTLKSCNAQQKEYSLVAIGAHNKNKDVTVSYLDGLQKQEASRNFSKDIGPIYNLHIEPLDKNEKTVDVLIALDNDGHLKEAVLGSVFWIGEITAKRVYHQVSSN